MQGSKLAWIIVGLLGALVVGGVVLVMTKGVSTGRTQRPVETAGPVPPGDTGQAPASGSTSTPGAGASSPAQPLGDTKFLVPGGGQKPPAEPETYSVATPAGVKDSWKPSRHVELDEWNKEVAFEKLNLTPQRLAENKDILDDFGPIFEKHRDIIDVIAACEDEARQAATIDDPNVTIPQPANEARERMRAQEIVYLLETMRALEKQRPRLNSQETDGLMRTIHDMYYRYEALRRMEPPSGKR